MSYLLQTVKSYEPVGSTVHHFGYKCEVKENKEVWAEIPDELYKTEVACGRILAEVKKVTTPVTEFHKVIVESVINEQDVTIVSPVITEVQTVKIDGRSKAAKQGK